MNDPALLPYGVSIPYQNDALTATAKALYLAGIYTPADLGPAIANLHETALAISSASVYTYAASLYALTDAILRGRPPVIPPADLFDAIDAARAVPVRDSADVGPLAARRPNPLRRIPSRYRL